MSTLQEELEKRKRRLTFIPATTEAQETTQIPDASGDKAIAQDSTSDISTTPTTKLEILMPDTHKHNDVAATAHSNDRNARESLPAEASPFAELAVMADRQTRFLAAIDHNIAGMTRKDWKDDAKDVAKFAAGAAVGVGLAYGAFAAGKYFFSPAE